MINKTILSTILYSAITIGSIGAAVAAPLPVNMGTSNQSFDYTAPVTPAKNQITLGLGLNGISSKYDSADGGFALGLDYTRSFNKNIGLFVAANTSLNVVSGLVSSIINGSSSTDLDYTTLPIALQFTLPLGNSELFTRVGANVFALDEETSYYTNNVYTHQTDDYRYGVGFYAAAGWQYNFGFGETKHWTIGLNYQFYRMKQYQVNQYMLNLGYRF